MSVEQSEYNEEIKKSESNDTAEVLNTQENNEKKEIINTTSTASDNLMNDITSSNIKWLNEALSKIDKMPDVPEKSKKTFKEYVKEWNIMWAVTEALDFIWDMFWSFLSTKNWWTFTREYSNILNNLEDIDFQKMNKSEIEQQIKKLEIKKNSKSDINKKLSITYIISIFKEQLIKKSEPNIDKFWLLERNMTPWTVLLLNKKSKKTKKEKLKSKAGRLALENYDDSLDVSFTHSVIVSHINPTKIIQSTMSKFWEKWSWVQEIPLKQYLLSYNSVDVLALDMPQENKDKALKYSNQKLTQKTWYDDWAALNELSWWIIWSDNIKNVNCVELIAEWLWENKIKNISNPNDFLKSDILNPIYMTTI